MSEKGPIYGVELIDSLPLGKSGMLQAMPTRDDLRSVRCERVAAGYEVLLAHYLELKKRVDREVSEAEKFAWGERHDLGISGCDLIAAFDDAASLRMNLEVVQ